MWQFQFHSKWWWIILSLCCLLLLSSLNMSYNSSYEHIRTERLSDSAVLRFEIDQSYAKQDAYYNIGDMMNMPAFSTENNPNWSLNATSGTYLTMLSRARQVPGSITDIYFENETRTHDEILNSERKAFPQFPQLFRALEKYSARRKGPLQHLNEVRRSNCLLVHFRSGDKGHIDEAYVDTVVRLSSNFSLVIVMSGNLNMNIYMNVSDSQRVIDEDAKTLHDAIVASGKQCIIHFGRNPDDDLLLMNQARHLLLHRGGFSALGGIMATGNTYFSPLMQKYTNNTEAYLCQVSHPHIL